MWIEPGQVCEFNMIYNTPTHDMCNSFAHENDFLFDDDIVTASGYPNISIVGAWSSQDGGRLSAGCFLYSVYDVLNMITDYSVAVGYIQPPRGDINATCPTWALKCVCNLHLPPSFPPEILSPKPPPIPPWLPSPPRAPGLTDDLIDAITNGTQTWPRMPPAPSFPPSTPFGLSSPPPPYYPAPDIDMQCKGDYNPNVDCSVNVYAAPCQECIVPNSKRIKISYQRKCVYT